MFWFLVQVAVYMCVCVCVCVSVTAQSSKAAAACSLTFQELAHIAQGGRPIEKWLRNQIFMGRRRRLPLFRDQLAATFVTLLHKQIDQD